MTLTQVSIFFNIIIMYIHIFRRRFTPWGVDGTMVINGVIICGTVEHPNNYLHAGDYLIIPEPIKFKKIGVEYKKKHHKKEKEFKTEIVEEYKTMPLILKDYSSSYPVSRKPYITAGVGPLALKHGSIVMGKSLMSGVVAYDGELFKKFCKKINELADENEQIDLHIKDLGEEEIPLKYLAFSPGKVL